MAYFIGSMIGSVVGNAIATGVQNSRERAAIARWNSPLSRLGRCGIFSLRARNARIAVHQTIIDTGMSTWHTARDVRLVGGHVEQVLALGPGGGAIVETVIGDEYIGAVRRADAGGWVLSAQVPDLRVRSFVCRADSKEEPRELPGPSGSLVTVAGLPWLSGLLRRHIGYEPNTTLPPGELAALLAAAQWRVDHQGSLARHALRRLPPQVWWILQDLYLDDGKPGTVDLVIAGPGGVFVIDFSMTGEDESAARIRLKAHRVRNYIPHVDVFPLIATEGAITTRVVPRDPSGYPVVWLNPNQVLEFLLSIRRRGMSVYEIGTLNAPAPNWFRHVVLRPSGEADTFFQWQ